MRKARAWRWIGMWLFGGILLGASATTARADTNSNCGEPLPPSHYIAGPGDNQDRQHIAASRTFSGQGSLDLNVCSGEVHVRVSGDGRLRLRVETATAPSGKMSAYVKDFDVSGDHATVSLEFPRKLHAVVTLEVPAPAALHSQINLGFGTLYFSGNEIHGDRELNVGAGTAMLYLDGDRGYANLEANVGMGSFHDDRPGGTSSHFIISRHFEGSGEGKIEVNVGAGTIHIEPRHGETI